MIVKYLTTFLAAGSDGGLTAYKNGLQQAVRARAYPVVHNSNAAVAARWRIATLSMDWEDQLTGSDRIAWGAYAYATPLTDAYGLPRYIKGYAHFMRSNRPLLQFGLPPIYAGPAVTGLPEFTEPDCQVSQLSGTVQVSIDNTDDWANEDGATLLMWISRPTTPTRNYPTEIYQPLGMIPGSSTDPPAGGSFPLPDGYPSTVNAAFIRSSVTRADGRLSEFAS